MARWDSADLVAQCREQVGRPSVDNDNDDADWYMYLSQAQDHWMRQIAMHVPQPLWSDWSAMTLSGLTYVAPAGVFPAGITEAFAIEVKDNSTGAILDKDEYILDVDPSTGRPRIRIPYGGSFTWTPSCRVVAAPLAISGSQAPTLKPDSTRILLVYDACARWARKGERHDPQHYLSLLQTAWHGDPALPGDLGILAQLKQQFMPGELELSEYSNSSAWWRSGDLR